MRHTIFITGGTGYLGSFLIRALNKENFSLHCLRREKSNISEFANIKSLNWVNVGEVNYEKYFYENKIDIIIHCATNYGRKREVSEDIFEANLVLPVKILNAAIANKVKLFINTDTLLNKKINEYSASKKKFLQLFEKHKSDIVCANVCLDIFYGPKDDKNKLIPMVIHKLLTHEDKIDLTSGDQKRNFVYIDDVISAYISIIQSSLVLSNGFYNYQVSSGPAIEIKTLILKLKDMTNNIDTKLNFGKIPYRANEVMTSVMDNNLLLSLGWKPFWNLDEGLYKTIEIEKLNISTRSN